MPELQTMADLRPFITHAITCSCGFKVEGEQQFVINAYEAHGATFHGPQLAVTGSPLIQRAIAELSAHGSALRGRLQAAAADLLSAGYTPEQVAQRIHTGEPVG